MADDVAHPSRKPFPMQPRSQTERDRIRPEPLKMTTAVGLLIVAGRPAPGAPNGAALGRYGPISLAGRTCRTALRARSREENFHQFATRSGRETGKLRSAARLYLQHLHLHGWEKETINASDHARATHRVQMEKAKQLCPNAQTSLCSFHVVASNTSEFVYSNT
jgi:hypothetical protein